ncbi:MAG: SRPBCC domain-containing protein [Pseudomonadota bacterium]
MTAIHKTETLTRTYPVPVARVFAAWADAEARRRWGSPSPAIEMRHEQANFAEGGRDVTLCLAEGEQIAEVYSHYIDIRPDARIVLTETIEAGGARMGISLVTARFVEAAEGCTLTVTLQTTALDGHGLENDVIEGWQAALEMLAGYLGAPVSA